MALAAAITAALLPSLREPIAVAGIGLHLVIGNLRIGALQRAQVRQDLALAARVRSERARHR